MGPQGCLCPERVEGPSGVAQRARCRQGPARGPMPGPPLEMVVDAAGSPVLSGNGHTRSKGPMDTPDAPQTFFTERLALALPPLTTKDDEKETNNNKAKTRRQEESWWQLSSSDLFADSRTEAFAG